MTVRPFLLAAVTALLVSASMSALATPESSRSRAAVSRVTPALTSQLAEKQLALGARSFIQILKQDNELRLYLQSSDETYKLFKTYQICSWSGALGPKLKEGDGQSPEGFYSVKPGQMNPASSFHLSFNLGFPNRYDRAHGRTGSFLMVHGSCVSIGCYAMTNPSIEEIWTIMVAAYANGQKSIPVHAFPFAMTDENLATHSGNEWSDFWDELKPAWDKFEQTGQPPEINTLGKNYIIADE